MKCAKDPGRILSQWGCLMSGEDDYLDPQEELLADLAEMLSLEADQASAALGDTER